MALVRGESGVGSVGLAVCFVVSTGFDFRGLFSVLDRAFLSRIIGP